MKSYDKKLIENKMERERKKIEDKRENHAELFCF
jgi:hypothetical protein